MRKREERAQDADYLVSIWLPGHRGHSVFINNYVLLYLSPPKEYHRTASQTPSAVCRMCCFTQQVVEASR